MRPPSIIRFDRLYLGFIAIGAVGSALEWDHMVERVRSTPDAAQLGSAAIGVVVGTIALGILVSIILWYFAAHRRSVIAKWLLTALCAFGALSIMIGLGNGVVGLDASGIVRLLGFALQVAAVANLFRADATEWFSPDEPEPVIAKDIE